MARTLVTGGTGLIGAHVAQLLVARGERPVLLELSPRPEALADLAEKVELVEGDVLNLDQVRSALREHGVTRIIHTAALRGLTAGVQANPYDGARLNFDGTLNILEAARLEDAERVVFSSSSTVYFGSLEPAPERLVESMTLRTPPSVYAATKLASEFLGQNYARWFGVEFTAVRYARVIGPQTNPITPHGVALKAMAQAAVRGEAAEVEAFLFSEELLYYKDAARGTVLAALKKGAPAPVYNIGSGDVCDMPRIIAALKKSAPDAKITTRPLAPDFPYQFPIPPLDGELAARHLGYAAEYTIDGIMAEYCGYFRAHESP